MIRYLNIKIVMVYNMWNVLKSYKKPVTKEEEDQEFQSIFQMLSAMSTQGAPRVLTIDDSLPLQNEIILPESELADESTLVNTSNPTGESNLEDEPKPAEKDIIESIGIVPVKRKRGRPKKSESFHPSRACEACGRFVRKNKKWNYNYEHALVCKKWMNYIQLEQQEQQEQKPNPLHESFYLFMTEQLRECMTTKEAPLQCRHCEISFLNRSNLHHHLHYSKVCNRFCYELFKKKMKEIYL